MPPKPALTGADKEETRRRLRELCRDCWTARGYKRTNVKGLCAACGPAAVFGHMAEMLAENLFEESIYREGGLSVLIALS